MALKHSDYIRDGLTVRIRGNCGGAYGGDADYDYGMFYKGEMFLGMRYTYHAYTEFEEDPDERDGIGAMRTIRKRSMQIGEYAGGMRHGFGYDYVDGKPTNIGFYENGVKLDTADFMARYEPVTLESGEVAYGDKDHVVICVDDSIRYIGSLSDGEMVVCLGAVYAEDGELVYIGLFDINGEQAGDIFVYNDWEPMAVDDVVDEGYSVLREITFFSGSDSRHEITEGYFRDGALDGLGMMTYESHTNGFWRELTQVAIFSDGDPLFGYYHKYESGTRGMTVLGMLDGRSLEDIGEMVTYEGKRYIGQVQDGVPHGFGELYISETEKLVASFKNGKAHGVGGTMCLKKDGEWKLTSDDSWGLYVDGEYRPDMNLEQYYELEDAPKC